jgi:soluble cytochrome b562
MKWTLRFGSLALTLALLLPARADTAMESSMKNLAGASKQLKADLDQTDDTKHAKDVDLKSVATIKAEALKSHDLVPKKAKDLPPDQQQAMVADFQKDMDAFAKDIDTLNGDIQTDKWEAARADFKKLIDDEKAGHKAYRVKK